MAQLINNRTIYLPGNTGGVMVQVDDATPADNVFVFSSGGYKFQWTQNFKGVYYLSQARVLGTDATDKTSILQAVLDHASVKTVVLDAQQIVTINGSLTVPSGKVISFTAGSRFAGSGTITGLTIDADYDLYIFERSLTLVGAAAANGTFSAKWFGATGNGTTDDTLALQKAIDTCVLNNTKRLLWPPGKYITSLGLVVRKALTTVENMTWEGLVSPYSGTATEASIWMNNPESFGIGLQKVKGFRLRNMSIIGPNIQIQSFTIYDTIQGKTSSQFSQGMRDNNSSPCAGIVVDPFGDASTPNKYPGFEAYYSEISRGGSTDIAIENCTAYLWTVGYMISPTGFLQNAEDIRIKNCRGGRSKVAVATGQSQTRTVTLEGFQCWDQTETCIDTRSYGDSTACPPDVIGLNIAGGVRYLCRLNNFISNGLNIVNMHAELLGSLGGNFTQNSGILRLINSHVDVIGATDFDTNPSGGASIQPARTLYQGDILRLEGCRLFQYGASQELPMNVSVNSAIFESCIFVYIPIASGNNDSLNQISFSNCRTGQSGFMFGDGQIIYGKASASIGYLAPLFTSNMEWHTQLQVPVSLKRVKRLRMGTQPAGYPTSKDIRLIPYGFNITLSTINQNSLEATFNIPIGQTFFKFLQVGDLLVTQASDDYGNTSVYTSFGKIVSKNNATGDILVKYIMRGAALATNYLLFLYKNEVLIPPLIIGTLTNGSTNITNVLLENDSTQVPVGVMINHKLLPEGTYIVSYNHGTATMVVSNPATGTLPNQALVSSDWQGIEIGVANTANTAKIGYKEGDIIYNNDPVSSPGVIYWTCQTAGITNTSVLPGFIST
jgi:hypothetical protein